MEVPFLAIVFILKVEQGAEKGKDEKRACWLSDRLFMVCGIQTYLSHGDYFFFELTDEICFQAFQGIGFGVEVAFLGFRMGDEIVFAVDDFQFPDRG